MKEKLIRIIKNEWFALGATLMFILAYFIYALIQTEGYVGGADSLTHYRFSRYSWQFPEFLLDHWAKPVFTLITSPFAQFGHEGVSALNLALGVLSAFFAWMTGRKLGYRFKVLIPVFIFFTPIYTYFVISGLTEILFGFFIIVTTYLCLDRKYLWAAILISFSHLVRTEGMVIIPVFGLYFLVTKNFRYIPWLFTGTILYSIIGYFHFNDIFWLITKMPYRGATDIYGTGPLLHFFEKAPIYFGPSGSLLLALGTIAIVAGFFMKNNQNVREELLIILLPFAIYFMAHSVMWWSGIGNSLGLHRYMAAIIPLGGLIALKGFLLITDLISRIAPRRIVEVIISLIALVMVLIQHKNAFEFPKKLAWTDKVIYESSVFLKREQLQNNKIYYYDPAFFYFVGFNPYDSLACREFVYNPEKPQYRINEGEIVIWDGHFSPILRLHLDSLRVSPYFVELAAFEPDPPFTIFDVDYKVVLFQRNSKPYEPDQD
jgi:hypothetical protein